VLFSNLDCKFIIPTFLVCFLIFLIILFIHWVLLVSHEFDKF
jgi:hypothetical protein